MNGLRYTFLTDGSSDEALMPILTWALRENGIRYAIHPEWADLRSHRKTSELIERIKDALYYYPCDLLFVHRDAEKELPEKRISEIKESISNIGTIPPVICVVPVRMQEAWLLFDENAIRYAAGNRNGKMPLSLPPAKQMEQLADPKTELHNILKQASGLSGRRLKKFNIAKNAKLVTTYIEDFSPLRKLPAFLVFEEHLKEILSQHFIGS